MAYVRCASCGAKALEVASKCPTCKNSFDVFTASGERVALTRCARCGIMHRRDGSCQWCAVGSGSSSRKSAVRRATLGVGLVGLTTIGVLRYGPATQDFIAQSYPSMTERVTLAPVVAAITVGPPAVLPPNSQSSADVAMGAEAPSVAASGATPDPVPADSSRVQPAAEWVPMVSRTWVNVRNDASRGGNVVGVINPSSRAMLGESRGGWRQVRSTDVVGWVDPKLFDADTLRHRG